MWVFDATPLIYLAKIDRLTLLEHYEEPWVIPERVYEEVVETGLDAGYPDARRIERSLEADQFTVVTVDTTPLLTRLRTNERLSDADVAVLACADEHDGVAVMDERYGRDVAAAEGITTRGTAYLVLNLAKDGVLDVDDARTAIDAMIDEGGTARLTSTRRSRGNSTNFRSESVQERLSRVTRRELAHR